MAKSKVWEAYKFPNGMVMSFTYSGAQIPELNGMYTKELHNKIKERAISKTLWKGFDKQ